jgi:spore maturation protein CgeB
VVLRGLLDLGLRVWGTEWEGSGVLEAAVQRGGARIPTDDCVRIFNATDVNVNLHSSTWVDGVDPRGDYVNPRTFELAACGAFQLVDARALLPACFAPDELTTFATADALRDAVRDWLGRPDDRRAVALAARERVLAEHTYRHRMQTLLAQVAARDAARLRTRPRRATVGEVAAGEGDTTLGRFLGELPPETPFTLDGVVAQVQRRAGELSEPEAVFLFLHQFDELYVKEARA